MTWAQGRVKFSDVSVNKFRAAGLIFKRPPGFLIYMVFGRSNMVDIWGLGGPGGPGNHSKRWGPSAPTVWNGFWGTRGHPDPKYLLFVVDQKTMCQKSWCMRGTWRETIPKGGGRRPPQFGKVSGAPGAAQTPNIDDF